LIDIKTLYGYSSRVRRKFLEKLAELPWEEVTRNREASWYSMTNIMVHMIDNEDWIVNWVINNKATEYRRQRKFEEYKSIAMIRDHLAEVEERTRVYIAKTDTQELQRMVKFTLSSGMTFDMTVEESLFQTFTEQLYHLGEIIALLWQDNIEPPKMQWFYNRDSLSRS
jgi:uncharacterized damage-inducible protein DinB